MSSRRTGIGPGASSSPSSDRDLLLPLPDSPVVETADEPDRTFDDNFEHEPPIQRGPSNDDSRSQESRRDPLIDEHYDADDEAGGSTFLNYSFNPSGTSTLSTVFLIVNAALGAGLLNFPRAFDDAGGVAVALTVQSVLLIFILLALLILAYCADQNGAATIQEAMQATSGKWGSRITSVCVILYTLGTTITFLIIIGDQFDRAFATLYGETFCHYWYMNRNFTMPVSSICIILPMCYSKKIDFLRIPSTLGVLAILYIVALIVYEYFYGGFTPGHIKTQPSSLTDVFLVVPDICFGYQCHVSVIPIYSCMRHRKIKHFSIAAGTAVLVCAICYTCAATFGYWTFGGDVDNDVLMSYSATKRVGVIFAVVAMALKTFSTYPILLFCGREAIRSLLIEISSSNRSDPDPFILNTVVAAAMTEQAVSTRWEKVSRVFIVTIWFAVSLTLALLIPNIGEVIRLLGSLAAVFIFVLPGIGLFQYANKTDPSLYLWKTKIFMVVSIVFVSLGAFIFGVVFTQAVQHNMKSVATVRAPLCV